MFAANMDRREKYYRPGRVCFAFFAAVFGGIVCGISSLLFARCTYEADMFVSYLQNLYILLLNMAPPVLLSIFFYLLTNRAVWSYLLTNVCVMVPTLVHYYKIALRGDALLAEDLALVTEAQNMLETYDLFLDRRITKYILLLVVSTLLLALLARGRFRRKVPRLSAALAVVLIGAALTPLYTSGKIYDQKTANTAQINQWSETQQYVSKGFVYPFLHSVKSAFHPAPSGYDADEAAAALAQYTDEVIPDDKKVNIVCIMLEAYNDFSRLEELTFTTDIYEKYHELEAMGYSGDLIVDIFAGDTRISEREFLTGMPYKRMDNFVADSNSYVWYLRQNGYTVEGSHPCYAWFYNREHINQKLGFENYYFSENYFKPKTGGDITYDARLFPMMRDIYLARDVSKPYFSFSITYQGHGPYESNNAYFDAPYVQRNAGVTDADETILNNYLYTISGTTEHLYTFATDMLATEEPLVLVFFGDHKPWLGNNGSVYGAYGINIDTSTEEGFRNYYGTRYLILANDAAKAVCGNDFMGEGETISVSFLMNKVFALCGYKGSAYMQLTSGIMQQDPVIHRTDAMADGGKKLYDCVSYYYRKNFMYDGYETSN